MLGSPLGPVVHPIAFVPPAAFPAGVTVDESTIKPFQPNLIKRTAAGSDLSKSLMYPLSD